METINISKAKSHFSEMISRAAAGERFLIHRRERPLAALISVDELERLERASLMSRRLALALGQRSELIQLIEDGEVHPAMAAFGLWKGEQDLEDLAEKIIANRQSQNERPNLDI